MKMKGWEFHGTNKPLEFVERDIPKAKKDHVVVEVKACGLCHTDYTILTDPGWMSVMGELPIILGHEVAGEIYEIGEGVTGWNVGDRVALSPMPGDDGGYGVGTGRDGGYSTHVLVEANKLIAVPDNVSIAQAAAATDAGMSSHGAMVLRGKVEKGMKVGLIGLGGLGKVGLQIAIAKGAEVYVATRKKSAQEKALELGAKEVTDDIVNFADKKLDLIVDFAGSGKTTYDAVETVRPGGAVVVVGMSVLEAPINTKTLIVNSIDLRGSTGGTHESIKEVIQMMADGTVKLDIEETTLDKVPEGLDRLHEGGVDGRLVMVNK